MTRFDEQHFDVESTLDPELTLPAYRSSRPHKANPLHEVQGRLLLMQAAVMQYRSTGKFTPPTTD